MEKNGFFGQNHETLWVFQKLYGSFKKKNYLCPKFNLEFLNF